MTSPLGFKARVGSLNSTAHSLVAFVVTGQAHLIRTRLIQGSTFLELSEKSLPDSYHFTFKMHS